MTDIKSWANVCYICKKETYTTEELLTLESPKELGGTFHLKCFKKLCKKEDKSETLNEIEKWLNLFIVYTKEFKLKLEQMHQEVK